MEFLVIGVAIGAVYGLMAVPLTLVWNTTGTLDLAIGGYALVGGITGASLGAPWGPLIGLVLGATAGAVTGGAYLALQARGLRVPLAPVLASVGVLFALISAVQWRYGVNPFFVPVLDGAWALGGIRIRPISVVMLASVAVLTTVLVNVLGRTRIGRWMRACAVSAKDAELVGIPVRVVQFSAFVLCGLLGAFGGLLLVASRGLSFEFGLSLSLAGLGALILFGMRGPVTAVVGGLILGIVESLSAGYLPSEVAPIAPLLFILVVLAIGRFDVHPGVARP